MNTRIEFDNQVNPPVKFLKVRFFHMQDFDQDMAFEGKEKRFSRFPFGIEHFCEIQS